MKVKRFPGVLWILPICLGAVGGIVAALIASLKYQASWWELFTVGVIINLFPYIAWVLIITD